MRSKNRKNKKFCIENTAFKRNIFDLNDINLFFKITEFCTVSRAFFWKPFFEKIIRHGGEYRKASFSGRLFTKKFYELKIRCQKGTAKIEIFSKKVVAQ